MLAIYLIHFEFIQFPLVLLEVKFPLLFLYLFSGDLRRRIILAVATSVPAVALLSIIGVYVGYRRLKKGKQGK